MDLIGLIAFISKLRWAGLFSAWSWHSELGVTAFMLTYNLLGSMAAHRRHRPDHCRPARPSDGACPRAVKCQDEQPKTARTASSARSSSRKFPGPDSTKPSAETRALLRRGPSGWNAVPQHQRAPRGLAPSIAHVPPGFLVSAAKQRLLAIASVCDLSRAPIGDFVHSTSLVRKRSPVRIRAWAQRQF